MKEKDSLTSLNVQQWFYDHRSRLIFVLALIVLETILSFSGLGFIYVGDLAITILQIPAIIAVIILGLPEGLTLAGVFGLLSMYMAYKQNGGPLDHLFQNPLVALVPRLMIPIAAWAGYKLVRSIADDHTLSAQLINGGIAAICGSVANTFFVVLVFMYRLLSEQDRKNAQNALREKSRDIASQVTLSKDGVHSPDLQFGKSGYVLLLENGVVKRSGIERFEGMNAAQLGLDPEALTLRKMIFTSIDGNPGACMMYKSDHIFILSFLPETEIYAESNRNGLLLLAGLLLIFFAIYMSVSKLVQKNVVRKIVDVNDSLSEIRSGNLEEKVKVTGNMEFAELSLGINTTVDALKATMNEITQRNQRELEFANAAHNPPVLKKAGQPSVYMDHKTYKRSLMLGAMEDTVYRNNRISLEPGDLLVLYTDGVTEATNRQEKLYGEERLQRCVEENSGLSPEKLIRAIHEDIDRFVDGAEQFDDITMVVLRL